MTASYYPYSDKIRAEAAGEIEPENTHIAQASESKFFWILSILLALAGVLLRIGRALLGRSYRGDEAAMAAAIYNHSLLELLTQPMGGTVTAPLGFLAIEKLTVLLLGFQDFIFRLIPLLAGCLSVILMFLLARRLLTDLGAAFAVGAFSLNWMLSFYSSDLKQYSTDVLIVLLIYLLAADYFKNKTTPNLLRLAAAGLLGMFFSHPVIFTLSVIGFALAYQAWEDKRDIWKILLIIGGVWVGVFLVLYFFSFRYVGQSSYNVDYWRNLGAFMPVPPWKNPSWFIQRLGNFLVIVLNLSQWFGIEAALYLAGILLFFVGQKRPWSMIFLGSMIVTILASGLFNYPFKGRLILFLAPGTYLAIGAGMDSLAVILKSSSYISRGIRWLTAVFLLWGPITSTVYYVQAPRPYPFNEDIKPALNYIAQHKQADDQIVVYDQADYTYEYYATLYGLRNLQTIVLGDYRRKPQKYSDVIDLLPKDQRIWFVFTNVLKTLKGQSDSSYILEYVKSIGGNVIDQYGSDSTFSSAYLVIIR